MRVDAHLYMRPFPESDFSVSQHSWKSVNNKYLLKWEIPTFQCQKQGGPPTTKYRLQKYPSHEGKIRRGRRGGGGAGEDRGRREKKRTS